MPVRSLNSSVFRWPDAATVDRAVRKWATEVAAKRKNVLRIGYFGSYARGDWGVGSDIDLVVVVEDDDEAPARRAVSWDVTDFPVPADLLIYTRAEWEAIANQRRRFYEVLIRETVWVYCSDRCEQEKASESEQVCRARSEVEK